MVTYILLYIFKQTVSNISIAMVTYILFQATISNNSIAMVTYILLYVFKQNISSSSIAVVTYILFYVFKQTISNNSIAMVTYILFQATISNISISMVTYILLYVFKQLYPTALLPWRPIHYCMYSSNYIPQLYCHGNLHIIVCIQLTISNSSISMVTYILFIFLF